jgi:hypothetical protein
VIRRRSDKGTRGQGVKGTARRLRVPLSPCLLVPLSLLLFTSGCNIIGAIAGKVGPEPTIPARFMPAKEPTLVLVENYHNPASLRMESDAVARHVAEELAIHEVAPIVEPDVAESFRSSKGQAYRKMPLDEIARSLGATQVIYVDLERFDVQRAIASELLGGQAEARVRVVNDAGELLWPIDSAGGYPVAVKVEPQRVAPGAGEHAVRQELHTALADKVAKLFYNWQGDGSDDGQEKFSQQ